MDLERATARASMVEAIRRASRGTWSVAEVGERFPADIVSAAVRLPRGIGCLLTAAHFHGLVPRPPREVWIAVPPGTAVPHLDSPRIRGLHWTFPRALEEGVLEEQVGPAMVRMTDLARTVVDLIRYGSLIGGEEVGMIAGQAFVTVTGSCTRLGSIATATGAPAAVARVIRFLETAARAGSLST